MNRIEINEIVNEAINHFLETDSYLMQNDVHEQTITGKIACHILRIIETRYNSAWNVDVEYNRNMELPKSLHGIGNVKPDILIHRRGMNNHNRNEENNLLIIETKKNPNDNELAQDIRKIEAFIHEEPYFYKFGAFLSLLTSVNRIDTEWYYRDTEGVQ